MRVPSGRDIQHLGAIAQAAMRQDEQHICVARGQLEGDFGIFVVVAPGEAQESWRIALRDVAD
jgi:hypothetical protein